MSTDGILEYQGTKRVLFRGDTSNIVFDTRTTSLGIGVTGSNNPSSNLYITGNAYVSSNLAIGGVMTMGVVNVAARHNLQAVTDMGNVTTHTVEFTNPTTSLVASGNVEVGGVVHGYTKISASGGTESTTSAPGYKIHTFTSDGTFTVTTPGLVEYLVVAGGGGAPGRDIGGGGGGGGVKTGTLLIPTGSHSITVGAGGQGKYDNGSGVEDLSGMKGGNSSIGTFIESIGGGGGRDFSANLPNNDYEGGSGGGGAGDHLGGSTGSPYITPGFGILPQGNEGGRGEVSGQNAYGGGGGGGAGRRGKSAAEGRHGGDGIQSSISGTSTYYGGGGGGAGHRSSGDQTQGNGGLGGGGDSNQSTTTSDRNGADGQGGGGGASRDLYLTGGSGGSGIVIIRYLS